jgi:hypothetical protein
VGQNFDMLTQLGKNVEKMANNDLSEVLLGNLMFHVVCYALYVIIVDRILHYQFTARIQEIYLDINSKKDQGENNKKIVKLSSFKRKVTRNKNCCSIDTTSLKIFKKKKN